MKITIEAGVGTINATTDNLQLEQLLQAFKDKVETVGAIATIKLLS